MNQADRAWEGLGGPIHVDRPTLDTIDPTLESCCRREEEDRRHANVMRKALQRHDVVAAKERARRNLVTTTAFSGCRCCYDPNSDGTGDYRALIELRNRLHTEATTEQERKDDAVEEKKSGTLEDADDESDEDEFDYLLCEEIPGQDSVKAWEEQRRAELEESMMSRERAMQHGYGVHRQMHPSRILRAAGLAPGTRDPAPSVVLHLVDPDSMASASLDVYLEKLAPEKAPGTKFLRSGGRSTLLMDADLAAKALPRLQPDRDMPALIVVRDGVAVNVCPGLNGLLGDDGHVIQRAVYDWLDRAGALLSSLPRNEEVCNIRPEEEALMEYLTTAKPQQTLQPQVEHFNCGVPDCHKTYHHEHVGIQNEQQTGLVVSEQEVLADDTIS